MLTVECLGVDYGAHRAVDGVSFEVGRGEVLAVLGPSGSGKSTVLRAVAGLVAADRGTLSWDGQDLARVPPHARGVGLLFQDFALFPHLDAGANVAFGLDRRAPATARAARVAEVLALVGLAGHERRPLPTLSGGELQRVALARALAPRPRILLLDEPLGSLDRVLRERLTDELRALLRNLEVATVSVTHDQQEAFALGGRVAVLRAGRLVQIGPGPEVRRHPADAFVARFLGLRNLYPVTVTGGVADTGWCRVPVGPATPPPAAHLLVPPEAVRLVPAGGAHVTGSVVDRSFRGEHFVVRVAVADGATVEVPVAADALPGDGPVGVAIDGDRCAVVPGGA